MEMISHFLTNVRWQDIVDIAFISYILFRFYILFRGTNAFTVLIGIVILWFFQKIAIYLGLIVTSWTIQGFTAVAAIIIIVIFRNEIRSVLQTKNLGTLLWGFPHKGIDAPVETITDSAFEMARKGTGALIVIPGREDIYERVHSAIQWDGLASKEMITSIFWHENPVHDGAAIVQGNKVLQVGAVLPLSRRTDFPSYYGTRHRAAAGLSETTDALVVGVSEERKDVFIAKKGKIHRLSRKADLNEALNEHLGIRSGQSMSYRKEKMEILIAALISVIFITAIWFSFTRGEDTLVTLEIPVEYMNRDPGMEIIDTSVNNVHLNLSGSGTLIKNIGTHQVKVKIDLGKAIVGVNSFTVTQENISMPPGVVLRNVNPPKVEVTLDKQVKKQLPVQVDWEGRLPENLSLTSVKINPEEIVIVGGSLILKDISTIYTEKVSLSSLKETSSLSTKLILSHPSIKLDSASKEKVNIEFVIKKREPVSQSLP
jgi:uncharacterized protein (TIGR00159 family)